MLSKETFHPLRSAVLALALALGTTGTALAGPGHGGGFHGASGFHGVSGFHGGGGFRGAGGFHGVARSGFGAGRASGYYGGASGGYRGRYPGYSGGYGGGYYRGYHGYGGGYGYRGWWGGVVGLGLFLAALPLYYETLWWDGIPYYHADNAYYVWDGDVRQYQAVVPPAGLAPNAAAPHGDAGAASDLYAYPQDGQLADQQAGDRAECQRWAASQAGGDAAAQGDGFRRAESACLQAHHYSVD